jgi:acetyltransferase-like isoleucine patch superfamily enzyme
MGNNFEQVRRFVYRWFPPPEYFLNHFVNRVPLVGIRMRLYQAFGVKFEDVGSTLIMLGTEVWEPRRLEIGARVAIGRGCLLDARGGIRLGADVNVSSFARFMTAKHVVSSVDFIDAYEPIEVGPRAWLALGATVIGGVRIGEGAVLAAGAVATKEVEPFAVAAGVPAAKIGERPRDLEYRLGYRPNWL